MEFYRTDKKTKRRAFYSIKRDTFLEPYETKSNFIFCKTKVKSNKLAETLYEEYNLILRSALNQEMLKSDSCIKAVVRTKEDNDKLILALKNLEL